MKYVALDIDGWLGGSCARFLRKGEKAIWSDFIVLGGKGKGRFGFIELDKGMGYTRQQLLATCQCFSDKDIALFDACVDKCVNGVHEGDFADAPRLVLHPNNVYEIINWNTYQHSRYPKGLTEAEAKALKHNRPRPEQTPMGKEIGQASFIKHTLDEAIDTAMEVNPTIADKYLDARSKPSTKELRGMNKALKEARLAEARRAREGQAVDENTGEISEMATPEGE